MSTPHPALSFTRMEQARLYRTTHCTPSYRPIQPSIRSTLSVATSLLSLLHLPCPALSFPSAPTPPPLPPPSPSKQVSKQNKRTLPQCIYLSFLPIPIPSLLVSSPVSRPSVCLPVISYSLPFPSCRHFLLLHSVLFYFLLFCAVVVAVYTCMSVAGI